MWVIYLIFNNFAVAILVFTIIVKLATFPLTLKQQKNTAISQLFTPKVKEIQTKYKNNQQKQQEELAKLQKQGYNPAGGCGTVLITFLILFGVIDVVYKPMTHMEHIDGTSIDSIVTIAKQAEIASVIMSNEGDMLVMSEYSADTSTVNATTDNPEVTLPQTFVLADSVKPIGELTGDDIKSYARFTVDTDYNLLTADTSRISDMSKGQIKAIIGKYSGANLQRELLALQVYRKNSALFTSENANISAENIEKLDSLKENMVLFGIDLGETPTLAVNALVIIPVLSFLLNLLQVFIQQYYQKKTSPELSAQMGGGMKIFMYSMPLLSLWIAFAVPAGVGFYWTVNAAFTVVQSVITNKLWPADKIRAEAKEKMDAKFAETEARATVIKIDVDGNEVETTERMSQLSQKDLKEYQRKKLEEARRADAEKYGEEYVDEKEEN